MASKGRSLEDMQAELEKGNVHPFYNSWTWKMKRKAILDRDNHLCQRCLGKYDPQMKIRFTRASTVHHIVPLKKDFSKCLDDNNLVSLCFRCHEEVENRTFKQHQPFKPKKRLTEERW